MIGGQDGKMEESWTGRGRGCRRVHMPERRVNLAVCGPGLVQLVIHISCHHRADREEEKEGRFHGQFGHFPARPWLATEVGEGQGLEGQRGWGETKLRAQADKIRIDSLARFLKQYLQSCKDTFDDCREYREMPSLGPRIRYRFADISPARADRVVGCWRNSIANNQDYKILENEMEREKGSQSCLSFRKNVLAGFFVSNFLSPPARGTAFAHLPSIEKQCQ